MDFLTFEYVFKFSDGEEQRHLVRLNPRTLDLVGERLSLLPSWTRLTFHQCPNCLLSDQTSSHCPLAVQLITLASKCADILSYTDVLLAVVTRERTISKKTTAQKGFSALMGLITATCGCPRTQFLKPMARFHLPLATSEETIYRVVSMYLLEQYFIEKQGDTRDVTLKGLVERYENLHLINRSITERLRAVSNEDLPANAFILLDVLAKIVPFSIEDSLEEIRHLFDFEQLLNNVPVDC